MPRKKVSTLSEEALVQAAREGLEGVARDADIGEVSAIDASDGVWTVFFESLLPGYPGWRWTITLTEGADSSPSVTEVHLTPGEGALQSPEWVPWADRLEEYLRNEAERGVDELDEDSELDQDSEDDESDTDFDDDDLDGVDIDELDLEGGDLDPSGLEVPDEPNDVFDHVEFDEDDPLDS